MTIRAWSPGVIVLTWMFRLASAADRPELPVCEERADLSALGGRLDEIEAAWTELDAERFESDVDQLRLVLGCVGEVLPKDVVARVHRAFALEDWVRGDESAAVADLLAASAADPSWVPPDGWLPDQLALRMRQADGAGDPSRVPRPAEGTLLFDGTAGRRPSGPAVVQWVDRDGTPMGSWYVPPEGPLPAYPVRPLRTTGRIAAIGAVAVGAGLYAGAYGTRHLFETRTEVATVERAARTTNALVVAGAASAGLGVTIGVVSW